MYLYQMILLSCSYLLGYETVFVAQETSENSFLIVNHHHMFKNIVPNLRQGQVLLKLRISFYISAISFVIIILNCICNHYCHGGSGDTYFCLKCGYCLDNDLILMPKIRQWQSQGGHFGTVAPG